MTVNGNHTREIQLKAENDLVSLVCDNYKGKKPQVCGIEADNTAGSDWTDVITIDVV